MSLYLAAVAFLKRKKSFTVTRFKKVKVFHVKAIVGSRRAPKLENQMKWKLVQPNADHCLFLKYQRGFTIWRCWKAASKDMTVSLLSRILANIFFTFRDHLTAKEGEISYSSVLPTSALLMVKEAIPSRNGCPYSISHE